MSIKRLVAIAVFLVGTIGAYAQSLTGRVVEVSGQGDTVPVPMTMLQWLNSDVGTYSLDDGSFSLPRTRTDTLVVSFPSYEPDTLVVSKEQDGITVLLSHAHNLSAVTIVANDGSYISVQPILTTVITQSGLRRAACCNLAESFESTVAVDMEYSDAITGAKQISMLGLAGVYSQIILENVPYIRLLTHQFGLGFVPGAWMESISVSKGVSSVTNGFEAISGQIDIEYKKPETNRERVFLNLYGNSMGKAELNFNTRFKVSKKDNASSMLFLSAGSQLAKMDMNKDGFLDVPVSQQVNVMNRWDYHVEGKMEGRTWVDFVWDNRYGGQNKYTPQKDRHSHEIYGLHVSNSRADVITKNGFLFQNEYESVGTILSYTWTRTQATFGSTDFAAMQNSIYANILYSNKLGTGHNHKITAGGSLQFDNYSEEMVRTLAINGPTLLVIDPNSSRKVSTHEAVPGIFGEYCYIVGEKLVVMAGMRLDYNTLYRQLYWTPRLHAKWQATKDLSLRASVGKGYRTAHVIAENLSLLTSNRKVHYFENEKQQAEEAYNMGVSLVQNFKMKGGTASFSVDYYYTTFVNQTILDLDRDVHSIFAYNLNGAMNGKGNQSRSHSAQAELKLLPLERFELTFAYRYNDVRYQKQGVWEQKALMSPHKALFNANYSTRFDKWKFNLTLQVNGPMRLPDTQGNPEAYRLPEKSKPYCILNAQVTKKFRRWEIYVGGENLLNYKQKNPILSADNPFSEYFDATIIYAPITGIMGYVGVRYDLK